MADLEIYLNNDDSIDDHLKEKNEPITISETPLIVIHEEKQDSSETAVLDQIEHDGDPPPYSIDIKEPETDDIPEQNEDENLLLSATLSPLEKLIKFSDSSMVLQRLVVTKDLATTIHTISLEEAINIVLPIVIKLGKDTDDSIREALATDLDKIMYFYYENAPPILNTFKSEDSQLHIPKHAFVVTMIEFLLDQNTTLASIAQQSIVTVAAELAETPKDNERYPLNKALLDEEIFDGVVMGLIGIFSEKQDDSREDSDTEPTKDTSEEPICDNSITSIINSATNSLLKKYDNGGVNLAKMVCLMLMSALAPVFGAEHCKERILPIVENMITDPMFYVRKEAAAAVGSLSTVVTPSVTLERLLPLYLKLSVDTIWHVRRSCVFALPLLCEVLPEDMKSTIAIEGVQLFKNDVSRNVRNSLADIMGELISKFLPEDWKETGQPGKVPEPLLEFFLSLGNNTGSNQMLKLDTERIHNCAYNFPAVVLTAGVGYWDTHLKDTYLNLTKDYQVKVRRTFAYSLHEIARIIGPERTERDLVQIFALYLMDLDDVKQGVLEHLAEFLSVLAVSSRNEYIPILAEVWDGVMNNWHLRDILANQLRDIARLFDASRVVEHILPLALRACHDEFAAVRESGVEIFPVILDIVKRTVDENGENLSHIEDLDGQSEDSFEKRQKFALALLNHVMEKLDELVKSPSYRVRLVFTQICRSLLEAGINPADFALFFLPRLVLLAKDPIVNIRIATSRTMSVLCSIAGYKQDLEATDFSDEVELEEEELKPVEVLDEIFYYLSTDTDQDVCHFIQSFIDIEKFELYKKRREIDDLEIAKKQLKSEEVKKEDVLPPPPVPPTHLIMFPSSTLNEEGLDDIMKEDESEQLINGEDEQVFNNEDEQVVNDEDEQGINDEDEHMGSPIIADLPMEDPIDENVDTGCMIEQLNHVIEPKIIDHQEDETMIDVTKLDNTTTSEEVEKNKSDKSNDIAQDES